MKTLLTCLALVSSSLSSHVARADATFDFRKGGYWGWNPEQTLSSWKAMLNEYLQPGVYLGVHGDPEKGEFCFINYSIAEEQSDFRLPNGAIESRSYVKAMHFAVGPWPMQMNNAVRDTLLVRFERYMSHLYSQSSSEKLKLERHQSRHDRILPHRYEVEVRLDYGKSLNVRLWTNDGNVENRSRFGEYDCSLLY